LHAQHAPNPARRRAVVRRFYLDAAIQMHDPLAVLVIAKRFQEAQVDYGSGPMVRDPESRKYLLPDPLDPPERPVLPRQSR
jgi:hypothetical protein